MSFSLIKDYLAKQYSENSPQGGKRLFSKALPCPNRTEPLVSIVTVVYNAADCLKETIESVIGQKYPHLEYILVDGGSTDQTLSIIKNYEDFIDYWVSEPDRGLYDAMNKGISLSTGQLIGILNAGDRYEPEAIATLVEHWQNQTHPAIFTGNCRVLTEKFDQKSPNGDRAITESGNPQRLPSRMIPHAAVFVTKDVYESQGLFDLGFKIASDFDFLCRCCQSAIPFHFIDQTVVTTDPRGISGNYYKSEWDYAKIRLRYALIPPWKALSLSFYSFITITIHHCLSFLGLWHFVEERRYESSR
jgi:glycosyltransferase involved in cell wall biosynthesis